LVPEATTAVAAKVLKINLQSILKKFRMRSGQSRIRDEVEELYRNGTAVWINASHTYLKICM